MVSHRSWLVSSAGERQVVYCCRSSCPKSAATRVSVLQAVRTKDWVRAVSMRSAVLTWPIRVRWALDVPGGQSLSEASCGGWLAVFTRQCAGVVAFDDGAGVLLEGGKARVCGAGLPQ